MNDPNNQNPYNNYNPYHGNPIEYRDFVKYILLSIVTCGLFSIYWFIILVDDVNQAADNQDATEGVVVFVLSLVTCHIYGLYWLYKAGESICHAKAMRGMPSDSGLGLVYLVLGIFGMDLVAYALIQNELNKMAG